MMCMMGARNTSGFSSSVSSGVLPSETHITYEGIFNELKFDVGKKTTELVDLHVGYARYQFAQSRYDRNINDYLALFLKSRKDGADRDGRPINAVICLDISGSMGGGLGEYSKNHRSRLDLSKEAIKMFISKLRPTDSIGLITFNDQAQVIFKPIFKSEFNEKTFQAIDQIKVNGGTTIKSGFVKARAQLEEFIHQHQLSNCENRMIMLTDVGDNSIAGQLNFVNEASHSKIHLTIIGISTEFRSEVCEQLKNVKGFNYFCAVNQEDIKKYVFETFDFGFFPVCHELEVTLSAEGVNSFEVFGSTDSKNVPVYNDNFKGHPTEFVVSRMTSIFPSELQIEKETVFTFGGLILIKLKRNNQHPHFKGEVGLRYQDLNGQFEEKKYALNFQFDPKEQFFSDGSLLAALEGFTFASEMKQILVEGKAMKKELLAESFLTTLSSLKAITPKSKEKDLENVRNIIEKMSKKENKEENYENYD